MLRFKLFLLSIICSITLWGVTIPKGTFYFDNSKTKYENVKFVYGSEHDKQTWVVSMTRESGDKWSVTFDKSVENMYRYTFAATTLPDGKIDDTFPNVKENISKVSLIAFTKNDIGNAFWRKIGWTHRLDLNYYDFTLNEENITRFNHL